MARKKTQKSRDKSDFAFKLIVLGILLFLLGTINHIQIFVNSVLLSYKEVPKKEIVVQNPKKILIPKVGIEAEVVEGGILNRQWILSDTKALYLPTSGKIGEGYNSIIYAHNTSRLFADLKNIKKDDLINVRDNADKDFVYRVYSVEKINPNDIRKLYSKEKNILTLFTCDGWFDKERLLVRAKLTLSTKPE